jgi:glucose-6-phosphate 1-dehydrogenase
MKNGPTQIIILGGTGDLSQRKLLPALLDLYCRGMLPETFHIIGLARPQWGREEYAQFVRKAIEDHHPDHSHTKERVATFCSHISYVNGSFDDRSSYTRLQESISQFDHSQRVVSNKLFYLAVPPKFYQQIFSDLKATKTAAEQGEAWTHILVEKPFGSNLATAQALDTQLAELYREDQIFRIDHYLAKEAVQNILSFRFANTLLRAPWNKDSIESVHIQMKETIDVGQRAGFYEGVGALRDVGQNHLLQLLTLVAMDEPESFSADSIRAERTKILQALQPVQTQSLNEVVIRGQYEGYKTNQAIPDSSQTERYFELKTYIDNQSWKGVPFYIQAGKALDTAEVSITIKLKDMATGLFKTESCQSVGNIITLTISPEQTISIALNAKSPGLGFQLETRTLSFVCEQGENEIKNSYEKVLFDSITGDQTLFTRTEEVLAAWKFITPILDNWHSLPLHTYQKGSAGPTESILNT